MINLRIITSTCRACGRQLTNPETMRRGVGPTCGGGFRRSTRKLDDKETIDMFNAEFDWKIKGGVLVIYDLNRGAKSVTNDMENVLRNIAQDKPEAVRGPIVYRDSEGRFDGAYLTETGAVSFVGLGAGNEKDAIEKIKNFNQ